MKISVVVLILALAGSGALFAAEEEERMPMHTVTADLGPLIFGLGAGVGLNSAVGSGGGWGIGAQYEFQPFKYFSVAGKFTYMGVNTKISQTGVDAALDFSSYSIELHPRWYPWGKTFFLDGMLGYANFTTKLDATVSAYNNTKIKDTMDLNYFKLGGELGWRIDFGKPGGFVFETALGWAGGIPLGGKSSFKNPKELEELTKNMDAIKPFLDMAGISVPDMNPAGLLNGLNDLLGQFLFVGGPKLTLALGWRF